MSLSLYAARTMEQLLFVVVSIVINHTKLPHQAPPNRVPCSVFQRSSLEKCTNIDNIQDIF
jgi:hypothetical protein